MPSKYWIKLYHEILEDPKMGKLSDHLWRRTIEIFLLAGDLDNGGSLPDLDDLSWRLRADKEHLETDLVELAAVGIVSQVDGKWIVTNFSKRQAPVDNATRQAQYRDTKRKEKYYGNDPVTTRNTDTDTDTDKIRVEEERLTEIFKKVTRYTPDFVTLQTVVQKMKDVELNQEFDDEGAMILYLNKHYEAWCKTKKKGGALYNPMNINWLDWAIKDYGQKEREDHQYSEVHE